MPAALKLRDSCHACATSKVKCNKEKPTCGRCIKRGLACEYFVTKRAGRKHDTRPSDPIEVTQTLLRSNSFTSSETGIWTPPSLIQPSAWGDTPGYPDILPDLFSPGGPASSSTLTTFSTDFDDFITPPISLPVSEKSNPEILTQPHIDSRGVNNGLQDPNNVAALLIPEDAFSVIDEAVSELPTLFRPPSPSDSSASTTSDAPSFQGVRSESSCSCLTRALGLLKQLFPNVPKACTRSKKQDDENVTCQLPTIQSVVAENKQIIEAISNMLQCPCSQDGYLLVIMSLIVFKVLDWYAAVARETSVADNGQSSSKSHSDYRRDSLCHSEMVLQSSKVMSSYCIDDEDQGRMAAQLILSELHRVQRLVNLLSQRLKSHVARKGRVSKSNHAADDQDTLSDGESTSSFSVTMMDQLEADLRKRLRALSLEIVDVLRRG